jgi:hypothetical protein
MEGICVGDGWYFFRNCQNRKKDAKLTKKRTDIERGAGRLAYASEDRITAPYAKSCEEEGEGGSVGVHGSFLHRSFFLVVFFLRDRMKV